MLVKPEVLFGGINYHPNLQADNLYFILIFTFYIINQIYHTPKPTYYPYTMVYFISNSPGVLEWPASEILYTKSLGYVNDITQTPVNKPWREVIGWR